MIGSVFALVEPGVAYDIQLTVYDFSSNVPIENLTLAVGLSQIYTRLETNAAGYTILRGLIPASAAGAYGGRLWIRAGFLNEDTPPAGRVSFSRLQLVGLGGRATLKTLAGQAFLGLGYLARSLRSLRSAKERTSPPVVYAPYPSYGATQSLMPVDPTAVTREHGASILSLTYNPISPVTQLNVRALINCYLSEHNEVVLAIFRTDQPDAVIMFTKSAVGAFKLDDFITISIKPGASITFDVRIGIARPGGTLFLNGSPIKYNGSISSVMIFEDHQTV